MKVFQSMRYLDEYQPDEKTVAMSVVLGFKIVTPGYEIISCPHGQDALETVEYIARTCYQSFDRTQEGSAKRMVKMLKDRRHHAMLEFGNITVKFIMDRGITHESVRHRLASFAQESTRYCDYGRTGIKVVKPKEIQDGEDIGYWCESMAAASRIYSKLLARGHKPQIARCVLPTGLASEIVVAANFREWMHIFSMRTAPEAHPLMVDLMRPLLADIQNYIPVIFDDIRVV